MILINNNQCINKLFKAGINFHPSFLSNVSHLMGVLPRNKLSEKDTLLTYDSPVGSNPLPESYDVTQTWSECKSVVSIRDQSNCGSCWVRGFITFYNLLFNN